MAIPKAVQRQGDAAEAAAVELGIKEAPLSAEPTGNPPAEATNDPQPKPKVDQNDYKERFTRYKQATDQTIADLRQTLASQQSLTSNLQAQIADLTQKANATPRQKRPTTRNRNRK